MMEVMSISPEDRRLLAFEDEHPRMTGRKVADVRTEFGHGMARYLQRLHALCDRPEVEREFPLLAHRVNRVRELNAGRRADRRIG